MLEKTSLADNVYRRVGHFTQTNFDNDHAGLEFEKISDGDAATLGNSFAQNEIRHNDEEVDIRLLINDKMFGGDEPEVEIEIV